MIHNPKPDQAIAKVDYKQGYGFPEEWLVHFNDDGTLHSLCDKQGNIITDLEELKDRNIRYLVIVSHTYLISP